MKMPITTNLLSLLFLSLYSCAPKENINNAMGNNLTTKNSIVAASTSDTVTDTATFGAGCFWCVEAVFEQLNGVLKVTSGYSGGHVANPTYEQVCEKNTGHVEVAQIVFDPSKISYDELLEVFWQTHDPTTVDRQGNDAGPQYRSVIFYNNEEQKQKAEHYKAELDKSGAWSKPIVTSIEPLKNFYPAENYHQNYYINNQSQPYCYYVIRPKMEKFEKVFKDKLKKKTN
jgi:peptide-methionine (S)-S-oxide reductase